MSSMNLTCLECGSVNRIPEDRTSDDGKCGVCGHPLMSGKPTETDLASFEKASKRDSLPIVVDLWAPWCGPCRMVAPVLESLSNEFASTLKVVKVNVDESPRTAQRYEARSIPMLLFMRDGALVDTVVGAQPEHVLRARIEQLA